MRNGNRPSRTKLPSIWRHRDLRVVLPARALSFAGDTLVMFALTLRIHADGGGAAQVAMLLAAFAAPTILTVGIAGHAADRYDSRTLLVLTAAVQVAAVTGLALTSHLGAMYPLVVALQMGQAFANPAWAALLPRIVGEDDLGRATATQQGALALTGVAGSAAAGVLVGAFSVQVALWCAAATFALLGCAALAVRTRRQGQSRTGPRPHLLTSLWSTDGFAALRRDRVNWVLFGALLPFVLALETINVVEVFLVKDALGGSTIAFGTAQAASAAGAVIGAWCAARLRTQSARIRLTLAGVAAAGLAILAASAAPSVPVLAVAFGGIGLCVMASNAALWPVLMVRTPDRDRGKVNAAANGATRAVSVLALGVGAVAGPLLGPRVAFAAAGIVALAVAAVALYRLRAVLSRGTTEDAEPRELLDR